MSSPIDDQKDSEYVKLNVGGMCFHTTTSTLTKFGENMLAAMFSGRMDKIIDNEGCVFIDRSGKHFEMILNFLRDGTVPLPNLNKEIAELRAEANFFCIAELVEICDQALVAQMNMGSIGPIYFMAMPKPLEEKVIKTLSKPAIILEINSNRSYPTFHVEFFEKLSFDFSMHLFFIRYTLNTISSDYVCQWKFYANGKILNNIVCNASNFTETDIRIALEQLLLTLIPKS